MTRFEFSDSIAKALVLSFRLMKNKKLIDAFKSVTNLGQYILSKIEAFPLHDSDEAYDYGKTRTIDIYFRDTDSGAGSGDDREDGHIDCIEEIKVSLQMIEVAPNDWFPKSANLFALKKGKIKKRIEIDELYPAPTYSMRFVVV